MLDCPLHVDFGLCIKIVTVLVVSESVVVLTIKKTILVSHVTVGLV